MARASSVSFFFHAPPTAVLYTLSLHDALPISLPRKASVVISTRHGDISIMGRDGNAEITNQNGDVSVTDLNGRLTLKDRKSTRLNSSHRTISYAVFCLKKKK